MEFGIIIFIVIAIAVICMFMKVFKIEDKAAAEQEERLKDETIYDPITGKNLTLEQLENEIQYLDDSAGRIKSDQEIEENYREEEKGTEYTIRHTLQSEFFETEDERIFDLIEHSEIFKSSQSHEIHYLWEIKPEQLIGIVHVSYRYPTGSGYTTYFESQLFGIVQSNISEQELKRIKAITILKINNTQVFRIENNVKYQNFLTLLKLIENA